MRFLVTSFVVLATLATLAAPAWAQAHPPSPPKTATKADKNEAARLKKEADVLMDQGRHIDALALYARAYELTTDPALLYNQGRALEAMGEYPDALDKLERFDKEAPTALRAKVPGLRDLLTDLKNRIATLVVTCNVPGARLLVRDKAMGTIDKEIKLRTRAGPATIEVALEGYQTFQKDIDLGAGSGVKIDVVLQGKKADPLIVVKTRPIADITIDGKAIGRSPLQQHVTAGPHVLVASAGGYDSEKIKMTVDLGDKRDLDLDLKKTPGLTSRWWFWTGLAVIVAAGAATIIAFQIEGKATPGSFGTGTVTGP